MLAGELVDGLLRQRFKLGGEEERARLVWHCSQLLTPSCADWRRPSMYGTWLLHEEQNCGVDVAAQRHADAHDDDREDDRPDGDAAFRESEPHWLPQLTALGRVAWTARR